MDKLIVISKYKSDFSDKELTPYQRLMPLDFPVEVRQFNNLEELKKEFPDRPYMTLDQFKIYHAQFPSFQKSEDEEPWWKIW
jgi:hypothetical protein